MSTSANLDLVHHTQKLKGQLRDMVDHLRADVDQVSDPRARSMFETSAEVLAGLVKAFDDYENQDEAAWSDAWESGSAPCRDSEL